MKEFIKYTLVWVSSNLAIPFWTIGHIHLSINIYEDIHEILMSCGMNIIVLIGFIIEYKKEKKDLAKD
jgi:predicted Co/Zn/Cd cation transporter (cation efflux family)